MSKQAVFSVSIDGADVSAKVSPFVMSIRTTNRAGGSSDAATVELDDTGGQIIFPRPGALLSIRAGSGNLHSGDKWSFCLTSA